MGLNNITKEVNVYKKKSSRTFQSLEVREEMRTQQRRLKKEQPNEAEKSRIWSPGSH